MMEYTFKSLTTAFVKEALFKGTYAMLMYFVLYVLFLALRLCVWVAVPTPSSI